MIHYFGRCRNCVGFSDHRRFNGRLVWGMRPAYILGMADKPDPENPADHYSEEETAKRRDATVRAMIGMRPKPHEPLAPKPRNAPGIEGAGSQGKSRS